MIAETECFGRCLILDNEFQSAERDEFIYHEAMVQPAMILHHDPKKVAIIGGGEGAAIREVLSHKTVEMAVMVDLDEKVVECAKEFLPTFHDGSFSDERATVLFEDGRKFLEETDVTFDVIIIDITCPLEAGPAYNLFTKEFYDLVKRKLTPQGLLSVQASTVSHTALTTYSVISRTLSEVFNNVFPSVAHIPFFAMLWGFCLATNDIDPAQISSEEIDRRISERVTRELRYYDGITHQALFNVPKYVRKALKEQTHINMDNNPLMEQFPGLSEKD